MTAPQTSKRPLRKGRSQKHLAQTLGSEGERLGRRREGAAGDAVAGSEIESDPVIPQFLPELTFRQALRACLKPGHAKAAEEFLSRSGLREAVPPGERQRHRVLERLRCEGVAHAARRAALV